MNTSNPEYYPIDEMGMTDTPSQEYIDFIKKSLNDSEEIKLETSSDKNLEIYNILFHGHNGKDLPNIASRRINDDSSSGFMI